MVSPNQFKTASILGQCLYLYVLYVLFWLTTKHFVPFIYTYISQSILPVLGTAVCFFPFRTGSKLGISPLMLAAMNGHVPAVKLLLDMGSDINAQIETNRNTALTLACFQGRAEVVSLLLDRKANVEHRAKVRV